MDNSQTKRVFPLSFCVRDNRNGSVSGWYELRSARRIAKITSLLIRHYLARTN